MKEAKKKARAQAKLAELLGLEAPIQTGPTTKQLRENTSREGEAVLEYVSNPKAFKDLECRRCGHRFKVNRAHCFYCSDVCVAASLAEIGINWDWTKPPESRWYVRFQGDTLTNEPLRIQHHAIDILEELGIA